VISAERDVRYAGRVSSLGDYNGDGYDDFAIAASPRPNPEAGGAWYHDMVRVYLGGSDFRGEMSGAAIRVLGDFSYVGRLE